MKKYIIKDKNDIKKTIYAKDLAHALTFVDSKVKDDNYLSTKVIPVDIQKVANNIKRKYNLEEINYSGFPESGLTIVHVEVGFQNVQKILPKLQQEVSRYGWKFKSIGQGGLIFEVRHNPFKDSIKDEANLPTTIQALVNDEEAAIKAYEVAIKNLEGKIDETQMQVLINIRDDERRHIENLYAILNGQVTEKNLEDNISSLYAESYKQEQEKLKRKVFNILARYKPEDLEKMSNRQLKEIVKEIDREGGSMFEVDEYFRINRAKYSLAFIRRFDNIVDSILPR